ncbi:MAG: hypothetical protein UR66_C0001G0069 [Candidatus Moranbacteria bacterium GW2011_GWE1_35_17]|nr:MAG: hypothetical protein UR66_C0001G0069 [Candidatus Moranbacteria bacterium GW2011_GWE1_35_17]KKP71174.1 MAG: hypothetical protein UR65_C0035G0003 [Candidatus Moranbacteria bacterium GW2011_GWE2_35_164]KKP81913.1 MAG: hypothetical protein UR82_C0048G0004 [Candidatus Moranbacteria bacterium GW2011_GWF1_35_5]KKP85213.1 MAG: hypothetical protein UR83_C0003G0048 [Candidatus Moranbacteria bacterium GW2011_GWF2_35_54]
MKKTNKKINYFTIIKEATNITIHNKILWWFGLLTIFSGSCFSFNYTFPNNSSDIKFDEMEYMNMMRRIFYYWELYSGWIILAIAIVILIAIILYVVGLIGRGALIDSIFKVIKKENFSFSSGFKKGIYFLGRLFLIKLFFSISFLILLFILAFPVVRLAILKSYGAAILLGLVAFLLLVSIAILFSYFRTYAQMYLVGSDLGIKNSIKLAYGLFEKNIKESLIMGIVSGAVNLVIGIIIIFILIGVAIPGWIIGIIAYKIAGEFALIVLGISAVIIFVALVTLARAILNVFFEAVWILFFHEIGRESRDVKNLEEELVVVLPNDRAPESITH